MIVPCQRPSRRLANMPDAQREDETVKRNGAALVNGVEQFPHTCRAPALAILQTLQRSFVALFEREDVMRPLDQLVGVEFGYDLVAQTLCIEGIPRSEVLQALDPLRRADEATCASPH